jgi:hypothetical protein
VSADTAGQPVAKRVQCKDCGAEEHNAFWMPGMACPQCGSKNYEPVVEIARRSDYAGADRSQGFAREDIRFGRLAQWAEIISPRQLQRALFRQSRMGADSGRIKDLAALLLKDKALTKSQVERIHQARNVVPGNTEDMQFGIAVVQNGLATDRQVKECLRIQQELYDTGSDVPPLPLLLYEKRYVKEGHILALLKASELKGGGLLHRIKHGARVVDHDAERRPGRLRTVLSLPAVQVTILLLAIGVGILMWGGFLGGGAALRTKVKCSHCGAETGRPVGSKWPLTCEVCGKEGFVPIGICLKCGERVLMPKGLLGTYACPDPDCSGSGEDIRMLTTDIDEDALRARITAGDPLELP